MRILLTLFTFLLAAHPAASAPRAIDFVAQAQTPAAALSPNGRFVAAASYGDQKDKDGAILVVDLEGKEPPVAIPLPGRVRALDLRWVNDERFVFVGSAKVKLRVGGGRVDIQRIRVLSIDRKGADLVVLFEDADSIAALVSPPSILRMLPDEPNKVLMAVPDDSGRLRLWKVDVATGEAESAYAGTADATDYYVDEAGAPVFKTAISSRGTHISTSVSADAGETWTEVSEQIVRSIVNEPLRFQPIAPAGPGKYMVISQGPDSDRMSIWEYDIASRALIREEFSHPQVDVLGVILDPRTGAYLGARFAVDRFQNRARERWLQAILGGVEDYFDGEANVALASMSDDRQRLLLRVDGPAYAEDFYLFDRADNSVALLVSGRPTVRPLLSPVEIMRLKMPDGLEITSYVTHPAGRETAPAPLMVVPHGGPQTRDYAEYDGFAQFFASRGYRVIQTNFRGSSGYGESFVEAGHRQYGKLMHDDVIRSAKALVERGLARNKEMCIFGWSYGGYVATTASFLNGDMFAAAISTAGLSDLAESVRTEAASRGGSRGAYAYWSKTMGDPVDDADELRSVSAVFNADRVGMPVLLFHGEDDFVVRVEQSQQFKSALQRAGKAVEYHEYKDTEHGIVTWSDEDLEFMFNRTDEFCKEGLQKAAAAN